MNKLLLYSERLFENITRDNLAEELVKQVLSLFDIEKFSIIRLEKIQYYYTNGLYQYNFTDELQDNITYWSENEEDFENKLKDQIVTEFEKLGYITNAKDKEKNVIEYYKNVFKRDPEYFYNSKSDKNFFDRNKDTIVESYSIKLYDKLLDELIKISNRETEIKIKDNLLLYKWLKNKNFLSKELMNKYKNRNSAIKYNLI